MDMDPNNLPGPSKEKEDQGGVVDLRIWELFYKPDHKKHRSDANFIMCRVCYLDIEKPPHEHDFTTEYLLLHVRHCAGTAKQFAEVLKIPDLVYLYENKAFEGIPKFHNLNDHLRKISQLESFKRSAKDRLEMATKLAQQKAKQDDSNASDATDNTIVYKPE
ncbi:unnamed protein product [Orchesella dallaii]|uniref:Uncharacterized protein n=1 Tax=Orchesella dallaii TaxID=48710 RepID=A0ABP1QR92_9HEXA